MICKLTNKLVNMICWVMAYGEDERREIIPDTEVSIVDFVTAVLTAFLLSLIIWWWIPCIWIYQNIKWEVLIIYCIRNDLSVKIN